MAEWDPEEPLVIATLAHQLTVSERTLYRAFHDWAKMGPLDYFQVHRLHMFRQQLLRGNGGAGAVSRAASAAGFDHLSRLAGKYKEHFGELPSETLKRRVERPTQSRQAAKH